MTLLNRLRAFFRRPRPAYPMSQINEAPDVGAVTDGVDYGQPTILPRWLRQSLTDNDKLNDFIEANQANTFRFQFDTPYRSGQDMSIIPVFEDPLREWNWATRERILSNVHAAYQRNPIAKRGVNYVASFVVGEGFNLVCKNEEVEKVLQDFIDNPKNSIREYERQAVIDLLLDGELITRFFERKGEVRIIPQRPWECEWIRTKPGDYRSPINYHFNRYISEGDAPTGTQSTEIEDVPADQILFVAINRHGYELRGRSDLYTILPWLRAYKEWLENRARQNHWRNALLWHVKVATASANVIAQVAARWRKPPTPGSIAVTSANEEINAVSNNVGAGEAAEDGRQIKMMSIVGLGLPEYFLGDGSNANLASATRQQMPALTTFSDYQRIMTEQYWKPVMRRVLQEAIDAGLLPEEVEEQDADGETQYEEPTDDVENEEVKEAFAPSANGNAARANGGGMPGGMDMSQMKEPPKGKPKTCKTIDAFDLNYEPLQQSDITNIAQAMNMALQHELVSKESASRELGFDYAIELKRINKEREAEIGAMMRGEVPIPMGMGMPGQPPAPPEEREAQGKQNAVQRPPA